MIRVILRVLLVWIVLINLQPAACIVNRKKNNSSIVQPQFYPRRETSKRKSYLQSNRPLWVLEDKVNRPGEINVPHRKPAPKIKSKRRFIAPVTSPAKLPSHYINLSPSSIRGTIPRSRTRHQKHLKKQRVFPVFDDYGAESEPIFVYRGPKAKMIFNTMMSTKKYPMKEPIPGQVMYPPYSPKFKPTPVVERVRSKSYAGSMFSNLTLIPFYTHEAAVDPRLAYIDPVSESSYEVKKNINAVTEPQSTWKKEDCRNCYHSYYSQNDVQSKYWSLPYITPTPETITPMNLRKQIDVPNSIYSNHRIEETTPIPSDDSFRITYDSETPNPLPKKQYKSVLSAKYKPFKNQSKEVTDGIAKEPTAPEETWLVWNSRNREAHKSNYLNSISIKDLPKNHKMARKIDHKLMIK